MAKIRDIDINSIDLERSARRAHIQVAPPKRNGGGWAVLFVVLVVAGALIGFGLNSGMLAEAVEVTQAALNGTSDTATN